MSVQGPIADKYVKHILDLPRSTKRALALTVDISLCVLTIWLAFCFRLNDWVALSGIQLLTIPVSLAIALPIFITMGLYRAIFRFIGWSAFITVIKAVSIYGLAFMAIFTAISFPGIPRTVGLLQPLLLLLAISLSRFITRYFLYEAYNRILRKTAERNVLIYGAGFQGRQVGSALNHSAEFKLVGYLDDDRGLQGNLVGGVKVYDPAEIVRLSALLNVRTILLAMPKIDRRRRNEIIEKLRGARVAVRTVPDLNALATGGAQFADMQELDVEDLLGREPVGPNRALLERNVRGKVVLVSGAAGSIGSELCRGLAKLEPATLLLMDQNEYGLYALENELTRQGVPTFALVPLLADIRDEARVRQIFEAWRPHTVYHAAAYKHVPLVEQNPVEGVKTNVFGTLSVARAAIDAGAESFILVSTDKAVRPTNIMGATKRLAEMGLQALAAEGGGATTLSMVRFGNVLGSSGSVVPLFRRQIRDGGPITLTHPDITRFFMTVPEATQLVVQAGAMASGGDVFVLDMGEPIKIIDLARRMVELSGLTLRDERNPAGDIAIAITGLRPAEKLYEETLIGDNPEPTEHPKVMRARDPFIAWEALSPRLEALRAASATGDAAGVKRILSELVEDYTPMEQLVDFVALHQAASE